MARRIAVVGATLVVAGLAACAELAHVDDYRVAPERDVAVEPPAPVCGGFFHGDCETCIEAQCCDEGTACRDDPACREVADCSAACTKGDHACRSKCLATKPPHAGSFLGCVSTKCNSQCSTCAGNLEIFGGDCAACYEQAACSAWTACVDDEECTALLLCLSERCTDWVGDPSCRLACHAEHPDASGPFAEAVLAGFGQCAAPCGFGHYWDCTLPPAWPFAAGGVARVRLIVGGLGATSAGLAVRPCDAYGHCEGSRTTDANGEVVFDLSAAPPPDQGGWHYEVGGDTDSGPPVVPVLFYPWAPTVGSLSWTVQTTSVDVAVGAGMDLTRGGAFVAMADCAGGGADASGVTFSAELDGKQFQPDFYGIGSDASSGSNATFGNLDAGTLVITARAPDGHVAATASVEIRLGTLTNVSLGVPLPPGPAK